jgi:hypothetical protein
VTEPCDTTPLMKQARRDGRPAGISQTGTGNAGVVHESPVGCFVNSSRLVVIAGSNTGSVSATEPGASKPALPARQSNTRLRCQSISYGVQMTVVDAGAVAIMAPLVWWRAEFSR